MTRLAAAAFEQLDLRCHALLRDVPLHDVWALRLGDRRPAPTILQLRDRLLADPHQDP